MPEGPPPRARAQQRQQARTAPLRCESPLGSEWGVGRGDDGARRDAASPGAGGGARPSPGGEAPASARRPVPRSRPPTPPARRPSRPARPQPLTLPPLASGVYDEEVFKGLDWVIAERCARGACAAGSLHSRWSVPRVLCCCAVSRVRPARPAWIPQPRLSRWPGPQMAAGWWPGNTSGFLAHLWLRGRQQPDPSPRPHTRPPQTPTPTRCSNLANPTANRSETAARSAGCG